MLFRQDLYISNLNEGSSWTGIYSIPDPKFDVVVRLFLSLFVVAVFKEKKIVH